MTFMCELDLDILKMYLRIKNKVSRSRLSKASARTRQTDTQTDAIEGITSRVNRQLYAQERV